MAQHQRFPHAWRAAVLIAVSFTIPPSLGCTKVVSSASDPFSSDELRMLREEESIGIESRNKEPSPPSSSEPYVMTEQDIRESGATDLPSLLRRILRLDDPQATESEINRRASSGNEPVATSLLVFVDGRPIEINLSGASTLEKIPVTLSEIQRLEMWKESASAVPGLQGHDVVIKIITKTTGDVR